MLSRSLIILALAVCGLADYSPAAANTHDVAGDYATPTDRIGSGAYETGVQPSPSKTTYQADSAGEAQTTESTAPMADGFLNLSGTLVLVTPQYGTDKTQEPPSTLLMATGTPRAHPEPYRSHSHSYQEYQFTTLPAAASSTSSPPMTSLALAPSSAPRPSSMPSTTASAIPTAAAQSIQPQKLIWGCLALALLV